jgi:CubicO group peptidase (beta-lactamase class C family)
MRMPSKEMTPSQLAAVSTFISKEMERTKVPGLSISIFSKDKILFTKGFGQRSLEFNLFSNPDTLYGVGSVTKSFTGLAIMKLVQDGKLELSDKITEYLPELKLDSNNAKVTISHLLTHTSGLPALNIAEVHLMKGIGKDTTFIPVEDYDDFVNLYVGAKDERTWGIGKLFMYSNEGFTLLGKIVEKVSKKTYQDFVKENILLPLGMKRSTFSSNQVVKDPNHGQCYYQQDPVKPEPVNYPDHPLAYAPGGLISSVVELSHYLRMWINEGTFGQSKILEKDIVEMALGPVSHQTSTIAKTNAYYNTGWMIKNNFFGHKMVSHSGSTDVSSANLSFLKDLGVGVAICSNSGLAPTWQIAEFALTTLIGKDPAQELDSYIIRDLTSKFEGEYRDYRSYTRATIREIDPGYLVLKFESDEMSTEFPLFIENRKMFTMMSGRRIEVPFVIAESGVKELVLERHRFVKVG